MLFWFFAGAVLGFELRASHWLARWSTIWATPPSPDTCILHRSSLSGRRIQMSSKNNPSDHPFCLDKDWSCVPQPEGGSLWEKGTCDLWIGQVWYKVSSRL
jgi:hypothetical protein